MTLEKAKLRWHAESGIRHARALLCAIDHTGRVPSLAPQDAGGYDNAQFHTTPYLTTPHSCGRVTERPVSKLIASSWTTAGLRPTTCRRARGGVRLVKFHELFTIRRRKHSTRVLSGSQ